MPFWSKKKSQKNQENPEIQGKQVPLELKKICLETPVSVKGKEAPFSQEMRQRLYDEILAWLPLTWVLDQGRIPEDARMLASGKEGYRQAAAVSMKDPNILTNNKLQKEVREYLKGANLPIDELLKKDKNTLYAILTFGHEYIKDYNPKIEKKKDTMGDYSRLSKKK